MRATARVPDVIRSAECATGVRASESLESSLAATLPDPVPTSRTAEFLRPIAPRIVEASTPVNAVMWPNVLTLIAVINETVELPASVVACEIVGVEELPSETMGVVAWTPVTDPDPADDQAVA